MGRNHHHHHNHHPNQSEKNLRLVFFLNLGFTIFEIFGGIYVNSIAIISDAIHDFGDSLSLGTAWYLDRKSKRKRDDKYTFGYARFSLLGALINSVVLILGSAYVVYEAIQRIIHPEHSDAQGMIIFAFFGIAVNGFAVWKMRRGKSLNERVIFWHLLEDVLGWVAILIVAIVLFFWDIPYLDPALSLLITVYILYGAFFRLNETLFVFLQGIPKNIDMKEIEKKITELENVQSIHDIHLWSLEGEQYVFTVHIRLQNIETFDDIIETKKTIKEVLSPYNFTHLTIETELVNESCSMLDS